MTNSTFPLKGRLAGYFSYRAFIHSTYSLPVLGMDTHEGLVVYFTGGTGYLGKETLKILSRNPAYSRIYIPVRDKKGVPGEQRFEGELGKFSLKCRYVHPDSPVPPDTNLVVLAAYSISFNSNLREMVRESCVPILDIVDQCSSLPALKRVVFVSTAYVQPPLPIRRYDGLVPIHGADDPESVFTQLPNESLASLAALDGNHPHTCVNSYLYTKTLMEHLIYSRLRGKVTVTLLRPSMISVSSDGSVGSRYTPPCATAEFCGYPVGRFWGEKEGILNHVHVDHVAQRLDRSMTAPIDGTGLEVVWATGASIPAREFAERFTKGEGCRKHYLGTPTWTLWLLRICELLISFFVYGPTLTRRVLKCYRMYDHFSTSKYDFLSDPRSTGERSQAALEKWLDANPRTNR